MKTKLITGYDTTPASVHDSRRASELVDRNDAVGETFQLDAGYTGTEEDFADKGMKAEICEKATRNHPLTDAQNVESLQPPEIENP